MSEHDAAISALIAMLEEVFPRTINGSVDAEIDWSTTRNAAWQWVHEETHGRYRGMRVVHVPVMFISYERAGEVYSDRGNIQDIRMQEIALIPVEALDDLPRIKAFFEGCTTAAGELFATARAFDLAGLMPVQVFDRSALMLRRASTVEDFATAMRAKSRLGGLVRT